MNMGELLLTTLVAVVVLGPKQLPTIAHQLGKLLRWLNTSRQQFDTFLDTTTKQQQLLDNQRKAAKADEFYQ
jgi:Sec-independent protein translocase protein TatA